MNEEEEEETRPEWVESRERRKKSIRSYGHLESEYKTESLRRT